MGQTAPSINTYNNAGYTTSPVANDGIWDNVVVKVNYSVIDDPEILSIARDFIRMELESANRSALKKESMVDWLSTDIVVLKVVVELVNNGDKPIYYMTNAFCEVCFNATVCNVRRFEPIAWRVEEPIALLKITVDEGEVYPLTISCTLDLRYWKVVPGASVVNEFYYVVTKPFRGAVKAKAVICSAQLGNKCEIVEGSTKIVI